MIASLPLLSVPFLVGGVSVAEVVKGVVMVMPTAVVLASLAVASSALLRRTQAATVIAYGLTVALTIGTFIVYGGQRAMDGPIDKASPAVLALNPFVATADVVQGRSQRTLDETPFTVLADLVRPDDFGIATDVGGFGFVGPADKFAIERGMAIANAPPLVIAQPAPATTFAPDAPVPDIGVRSEIEIFSSSDEAFIEGGGFLQVGPDGFSPPQAKVAGVRLWVAWLVASTILGGLALLAAVRRVTLPAARDAS